MTTSILGHIPHIFEDRSLNFRKVKSIIRGLSSGEIPTYEKFDGQCIFISWDFDKEIPLIARSKSHIAKRGLDLYAIDIEFDDKSKFRDLLKKNYESLKQLGKIHKNRLVEIFGCTGNMWISAEIIDSSMTNLVHYDEDKIIFHHNGVLLLDNEGEILSRKFTRNYDVLKKQLGENGISNIACQEPLVVKENDLGKQYVSKIEKFCYQNQVGESNDMSFYLFKKMMKDLEKYTYIDTVTATNMCKNILRMYSYIKKDKLTKGMNSKFLARYNDVYNKQKDNMKTLSIEMEKIFYAFGNDFLSYVEPGLIKDRESESKRIESEFKRCVSEIRSRENDEKGMKYIATHDQFMHYIKDCSVDMEGVVFDLNEKRYKLTGYFPLYNRICAHVKYGNLKKSESKHSPYLGLYSF